MTGASNGNSSSAGFSDSASDLTRMTDAGPDALAAYYDK